MTEYNSDKMKINGYKNKWYGHLKIFNRAGIFLECVGGKFAGVRMSLGRRKRLDDTDEVLGRQNELNFRCLLLSLDQKGIKYGKMCPGIQERNMY